MPADLPVADDEIIIKRIPPGRDNIKQEADLRVRATSFAIQPRPNENYSSWSRQSITSPGKLLELEFKKRGEMLGWRVAAISVAAVRSFGLEVVADSTDEDEGHCLIVETEKQKFTDRIWSKLARQTTIVYTVETES